MDVEDVLFSVNGVENAPITDSILNEIG